MGKGHRDPAPAPAPAGTRAGLGLGILCVAVLLLLTGCGGRMPFQSDRDYADTLADAAGLAPRIFEAGPFHLRGYLGITLREQAAGAPVCPQGWDWGGATAAAKGDGQQPVARPGAVSPLVVYIEGDGRSWPQRNQAPADPTPDRPLVLRLAGRDARRPLLYLARPCQYVSAAERAESCAPAYWTGGRFAPVVIDSLNAAIDQVKAKTGAQTVELIGYSGGGAVALLLAAKRQRREAGSDVQRVITVAGVLDHARWTEWHRVTPLEDSLNPTDPKQLESLRSLPQWHFSGGEDRIVPPTVIDSYRQALGPSTDTHFRSLPSMGHGSDWPALWPRLLCDVLGAPQQGPSNPQQN